jgi:hypothetical protein
MADKPVWRQVYDSMATQVGPRLSEATASDQFAGATEVVIALRRAVLRDMRRRSRRWLHLMNLPAGSDIHLLRREIGELERQVRELAKRVEETGASASTRRRLEELDQRVDAIASRNGRARSAVR